MRLRAENARLLRLLDLTPQQVRPPAPAAPIAFKGRLVQRVGRVLRPYPGKTVAEVHDYHDVGTAVLASSLAKRAPGYVGLGFPDPRTVRPVPAGTGR